MWRTALCGGRVALLGEQTDMPRFSSCELQHSNHAFSRLRRTAPFGRKQVVGLGGDTGEVEKLSRHLDGCLGARSWRPGHDRATPG
jgi:hypothetical protein